MVPCPPPRQLLACLDGQLDAAEREALEPHLAACARCQQKMERALDEPDVQHWRQILHGEPSLAARTEGSPAMDVAEGEFAAWQAVMARWAANEREAHAAAEATWAFPPASPSASTLRMLPNGSAGPPQPPGELGLTRRTVGRYVIERELGHGGMGVVYLGHDASLQRHAAVKMLLSAAHTRPDRLQRFLQEGAAVARLHHPHIVQVYEVGQDQGEPFLAMEYVEGVTLREHARHTPQPPRDAAALVRTLALAVDHAHQAGIIHRDLKPANILLAVPSDQGAVASQDQTPVPLASGHRSLTAVNPKIVDFGLAKQLTDTPMSLTDSNDLLGTPEYMAPEQVAGDRNLVGPATDVYALGTILYELLTGRPPFRAPTPMETLIQVQVNEPVPPRRLQPGLARDLETVCLKCLEKEPRRRYPSAAALAADLEKFLDGRPVSARRTTAAARLFRWCRRNRVITALSAALLLGGLVTGDLLLWQSHRRAVSQAQADQQIRDALAEAERISELAETAKEEAPLRSRQRAAVERAAALASIEDASPGLTERITRLRAALDRTDADFRLAARLDELRINTVDSPTGPTDRAAGLRHALADYGLAGTPPPAAFSGRLRQANPRARLLLLGELDRWTDLVPEAEQEWLYRVLERADDDPWRCAARQARRARDASALQRLAEEADVTRQPTRSLIALARALPSADRLALLHRARAMHADDVWLNMELALASFAAKPRRTEDALRFATVAVSLRDNPPCQLILGSIFADLGRFADAEAALRRAIALQPDYHGAYYNLANLLERQQRFAEMETLLRQGIAHCPQYVELHSALGHALRKLRRPVESEAAYRHALALKPRHAFALEQMIILCREQQRWDEALAFAQLAAHYHYCRPWSWTYLGKVLARLERWPEARTAFHKALEMTPDDPQLRQLYDHAQEKATERP